MAHLSRSQILVYGAVAVALLLLGARWIQSADERGSPPGEVSFAESSGGGSSSLSTGSGRDAVVHVAGAVRDPVSTGCQPDHALPTQSSARAVRRGRALSRA